jgi:hypothetical protein
MATKKKASRSRVAKAKKTRAVAAKAKKKFAVAAKAKKKFAVAAKAKAKKRPAVAAKKKATVAPKKTKKKPALAAKKKATAAPKKKPAPKAAAVQRRDGAGHLDAHYAATLRERSEEGRVRDPDEAFIGRSGHSKDNLAEAMGETWVETATSGEDESEEVFNQAVPEDEGGPFVTTTAGQEFAEGTDPSNPERSKREPFPKT